MRKWPTIVVSFLLLSGCTQSIAEQKEQVLQQVQAQPEAQQIAAEHPGEVWHVLRDDEFNVLTYGSKLDYENSVYCPEDFRVFYGTMGKDPDSNVYAWYVNIADGRMSPHAVTWAASKTKMAEMDADASDPTPTETAPPMDCADGKPERHSIGGQ